MVKIQDVDIPHLEFAEAAAPGTPASGIVRLYAKSDGLLYSKDDAGAESAVSGAGGAGLGAWTSYTPTLTAVTTNPTLGSSTLSGRYKELDGTTLAVAIHLAITTGGAWNPGSGEWQFSLPAGYTAGSLQQIIAGSILDAGTRRFVLAGIINAGDTKVTTVATADASGAHTVTQNVPITWATGDTITLSGIIETT